MKIGIIGLGLIGGSLGLDFRAQGHRVLGVSRKAETCERAIAREVVDEAGIHLNLMQQAEIIFVCTPLGAMVSTVEELIPYLTPTTILTDVGSVKGWVMAEIAPRWPNFVGGHPMAGTAESGIEAAQFNLFVKRPYVLTPHQTNSPEAVLKVETLVRSLQAEIFYCHPDQHDRAVAWISHLPVMVSASLIAACLGETDPKILELAKALASSGFRDTSRVGGGNPELGVMMAQYNQEAVLRSLRAYRSQLDQMINQIEQKDWLSLEGILQQNQQARPGFLKEG
jgi:arogenate dehydrogenase (NADP+)